MNDDEFNAIQPHNRDLYGAPFFKFTELDHGPSNHLFGRVLYDLFRPKTAIDFGCGTGGTISALLSCGVEVTGIDGYPACLPFTVRTDPRLAGRVIIHDLNLPWKNSTIFDLAICIECLEHPTPEAANDAVASIACAAPRAVITAAPPCGGNSLHLNEQPLSYWIDKLAKEGLTYNRTETAALATIMRSWAMAYDSSERALSCLVPSWFYDSYIGVFKK